MKRLAAVVALIVVAVGLIVAVRKYSSQSAQQRVNGRYEIGAVAFETAPLEKLDMAAKFLQTEVTHAELMSRSAVLRDLLQTKLKILTEAVEAKLRETGGTQQAAAVELYMEKPESASRTATQNQKLTLTFSNARPSKGLVKINDTLYEQQDLPLNHVYYAQIEGQIFEEKLRVAGDLYTKQLLLKIAKDNNTTIQGYINKSVLGLPLKDVTDVEVKLFAENKGIELSDKDSDLKEKLRKILQEQKTEKSIEQHLKTNFPGEIGKIYFHPPSFLIPVSAANALGTGSAKELPAPPVLVFSSLKCTGCGELADTVGALREKYKDKVRFGFVHFLFGESWKDQLAAQASFCLNAQNNDAFWDFFSKLAKTKTEISEPLIMETAKSLDINQEEFTKCFVAQTHKDDVHKQVKYAADLGVTTAPTVIYGARVLTGNAIEKRLEDVIASGLTR